MSNIAIMGDGSWGTAAAVMLHSKGNNVRLWGAFPDNINDIKKSGENKKFLPGVKVPADILVTDDVALVLSDASFVIFVVPSHVMREVCIKCKDFIKSGVTCVSLSKGIENDTLKRMSEIISEETGISRIAVLSGPSHAEEVVKNMPSTVVAASSDTAIAKEVQNLFHTESFRVYTGRDIIGVEIAAALKNVIAIAAGICDSLGFGDNSKAALLTRALCEISRLGVKMGAERETFFGLAGMGDLITTCISKFGRNLRLGREIGSGLSLEEAQAKTCMVAEGVKTAKSAVELAKRYNVEIPISMEVYNILYKGKDPLQAVKDLMARSVKPESL